MKVENTIFVTLNFIKLVKFGIDHGYIIIKLMYQSNIYHMGSISKIILMAQYVFYTICYFYFGFRIKTSKESSTVL